MNDKHVLSHLDAQGAARMVDVGGKPVSRRTARALAEVRMDPATLKRVMAGDMPKGDVIGTARIAGIMAAKRTHELIPLCHPLPLESVDIDITFCEPDKIRIESCARATWQTGVEMEALTAASVAALTIYDMSKAIDKAITIGPIFLLEKTGGKSGDYHRSDKTEE